MGKDQSQRGQRDQTVGIGRGEQKAQRDQARQSEQKAQRDQRRQTEQKAQDKQKPATAETTQQRRDKTTAQDRKEQSTTAGTKAGTTTGANVRGQARDQTTQQGQTTQRGESTTTSGAGTQGRADTRAQTQGATTQSASGRFTVSAQQQTTLQQNVLSSRNVARVNVNSVNFRINTGAVVPRHISFVSVAAYPVLIDYFPAYRDYSFFVVEDEIVFVDRRRRIVDVVPAGPRVRFTGGSRIRGGGVVALDLSPEEIRIVQEVLIERRLLTGRPTGVFDARTRQALIIFQRRQGIQASGTIDTRTVAALGVSNKISATQGQTTTGEGRGQAGQQQTTTGQTSSQAPAKQDQPGATGQAGRQPQAGKQRPPAGQTTGQAPARGADQPGAKQKMPAGQSPAPAPSKGRSDQGGSGSKY